MIARLLAAALLVTVLPGDTEGSHGSYLGRLREAALLGDRFTLGRLHRQEAWEPCAMRYGSALIPQAECGPRLEAGTRRYRRVSAASRRLSRRLPPDSTPETLQALALLSLRWHAAAPSGLDSAVALLERARRAAPDDPAILNDLAVVYLEQGQRDQRLDPMLRALDAVGEALARDSLHLPALFNRGVILERLYLNESAERAWTRYLAVEDRSAWKAEAASHARRLAFRANPPSLRELAGLRGRGGVSRAALRSRVAGSPQEARDTSLALLREWGQAVGRGERARAARVLAAVREIAGAIEAARGDASVRMALRAIDGAGGEARLRTLAKAHVELADGIDHFFATRFDSTAAALARAEPALRSAGSPAARWAAFYRAGAQINRGEYARADSTLRRILAEATPHEPALTGKAISARGVGQVRQGDYDEASRFYREARPHVVRAREPENEGAISYVLSESLGLARHSEASRAEAYRGLRLLSPFRRSTSLNNQLSVVAAHARDERLGHAALAVMNEVLVVAGASGKDDNVAWALRARARDHFALGDTAAAWSDLSAALRRADRLPAGEGRERVRADVMLARSQLFGARDPRAALRELAAVVETYRELDLGVHLPRALYEAAMAARASGDVAATRRYLDEAIRRIEAQQSSFRSAESRAAHLETVENVFDAMVELELDAGRPASAFRYLGRGRLAAWPRNERRDSSIVGGETAVALDRVAARLPERTLLAEFALLRDRVVIWTASRRGWRHYSVAYPRDSVAALAERFGRERRRASAAPSDARARLYELLVRPFAGELEGVEELTVVPDRELHGVPFAALWDSTRRTSLVEHHAVRTVPSTAFLLAALARPRGSLAGSAALVVGNPALDSALDLPRLPGAEREAERVARLYPSARLLKGAAARRHRVTGLLPDYPLFHFAGHAVHNVEQPELSYLALAPDTAGGTGVLYAWEIPELRLSNVRVAVLSACSTLGPRPSRAGPTTGLAYSFLRAGVPATVSTAWDVDDRETTELLVELHRRLAGGASVAEALRQAQLWALRSPEPKLNAPETWAAFIYAGP